MSSPKVMAVLETPNFTFYAFGESKEEAEKAMKARWKKHQKQTGAFWDWEFDIVDELWFTKIQAGAYERSELPA
jgi:hypothetical protein